MSQRPVHFRRTLSTGYVLIADPERTALRYLRFGILSLRPGLQIQLSFPGLETLMVLLQGEGEIRWLGQQARVARLDVFHELPIALYLPPGVEVDVKAEAGMEWAIAHAPGDPQLPPRLIRPSDLRPRLVGGEGFRRQIIEVLGPDLPARHLLAGETLTFEGNWSSYPPHKHDETRPGEESALEEIYFYKISPPTGFALQWLYTSDGSLNQVLAIRSEDLVIIPQGYHPVAAPPGYQVYYLWVMAGEDRNLLVSTDPAHRWLLDRYQLSSPR